MKLISVEEREKWNSIIKDFPNWDIYYLNEYAYSLKLHGDGNPYLLYWENDGAQMVCVVMENDVALFSPFQEHLEMDRYYDWTTPYGYGGFLTNGNVSQQWMKSAIEEMKEYANRHHIITAFYRFHPLLQNQKLIEDLEKVVYMKKTVFMDTTSEETIWKNMMPNNRNMVRKAEKNGVEIISDHGEHLSEFMDIYNSTMEKNRAEEYYFFKSDYFNYIIKEMKDNCIFFYALYEEKIISASMFFFNNQYMHYHLSGTLSEYNKLGATNLLLTKAAMWAAKQGIDKFHLGGGVGIEDSLLRFKKHFNRNGEIDFCIGCNIFDENKFRDLVMLRKQQDASFDENQKYMILYRA